MFTSGTPGWLRMFMITTYGHFRANWYQDFQLAGNALGGKLLK